MMKSILNIMIGLSFMCIIVTACQDDNIGFLITEYAGYSTDSMVVKIHLDQTPPQPNPQFDEMVGEGLDPEEIMGFGVYPTIGGEEYKRDKFNIPWCSIPIEGIEGTEPIRVSIKNIVTLGGNAVKLWECLSVRGDGSLIVPTHHDIPTGRYVISLNFSNESYSKDVNDCFTIIVK